MMDTKPDCEYEVVKPLSYGWSKSKQQSYIDLETTEGRRIRIKFADEFPPDLKLCIQQLQGYVSDERRKNGLPAIEHSYTAAIDKIEFGRDDLNQLAVIRTRFDHGGSQDTVIEKKHIPTVIQQLQAALDSFESQSDASQH